MTRQPLGNISIYGGVFVKEMLTPEAGTLIPQHAHTYDHISFLAAGAVRVWRNNVLVGDFTAPESIKIPALAKHRFLTLENWTLILCIHALADGETEADLIHEEHQFETEG